VIGPADDAPRIKDIFCVKDTKNRLHGSSGLGGIDRARFQFFTSDFSPGVTGGFTATPELVTRQWLAALSRNP
jgi:hypothetical protein